MFFHYISWEVEVRRWCPRRFPYALFIRVSRRRRTKPQPCMERAVERHIYVFMTRAPTRESKTCFHWIHCTIYVLKWNPIRHVCVLTMCERFLLLRRGMKGRSVTRATGSTELRSERKGNIFRAANFKLLLLLSFDFNWNFPFVKGIAFLGQSPFPSVHCFSGNFQVFKLLVYVWRVAKDVCK